jgi:hypothetical protein
VPQNKDLKRLVRARMAETSENYTQALTALLGETRLDPLPYLPGCAGQGAVVRARPPPWPQGARTG